MLAQAAHCTTPESTIHTAVIEKDDAQIWVMHYLADLLVHTPNILLDILQSNGILTSPGYEAFAG